MCADKPVRSRQRRETVALRDVQRALEIVRQYKAAGLFSEIDTLLKKYSISRNTVNAWLDEPSKAVTGTKAPYFVQAVRELPPLALRKRHQAYMLLLQELGLPNDHAEVLRTFHGSYQFRHRLNADGISVEDSIILDSRRTPGAIYFVFKYESRARYHYCDGLVIRRNQKIHLIGLSEKNMFFGNVNAVRNPASEVMYGIASFEELNGTQITYSPIVVVPKSYAVDPKEAAYIDSYLSSPVGRQGP